MKKAILFILCIAILFSGAAAVHAQPTHIVDNAGLLTSQEITELEEAAKTVSEAYSMDVVILTTYSLDGKSAQAYADDYYDENGYGMGSDNSGVLLLIAMETREWYISTCGEAIYAMTDYGIDSIAEVMLDYLGMDAFYQAFMVYLDQLPIYFEAYQDGTPIDGYTSSNEPDSYLPEEDAEHVYYPDHGYDYDNSSDGPVFYAKTVLISFVIGVVVAGIVLFIMCRAMNTARPQRDAGSYVKDNSYRLTQHRDIFLYSRVSKTRRSENSNSGRSGGGSSVHRSSGGVRHGGRGGRF